VRLTSAGDNGEGEKREGTLGIVVVSRARKADLKANGTSPEESRRICIDLPSRSPPGSHLK
jgi:hypothetical protein